MSIYPVKLNKWYPIGDQHHDTLVSLLNYYRCIACRKKAKINKAIGHHSLPFGHGDVWCSEKCFNSNKIAKLDKRNIRSQNRRWGKIWKNLN